MYFVDYPQALKESYRVLKPGGRAVLAAWGSPDQPLFNILVKGIFDYVDPPLEEPGALNVFAFAEPGSLSSALRGAGFREVLEETLTVPLPFPGNPERYWEWWVDMTPPFGQLIKNLDGGQRNKFVKQVFNQLKPYYYGEKVNIPIQIVLATGVHEQ